MKDENAIRKSWKSQEKVLRKLRERYDKVMRNS